MYHRGDLNKFDINNEYIYAEKKTIMNYRQYSVNYPWVAKHQKNA